MSWRTSTVPTLICDLWNPSHLLQPKHHSFPRRRIISVSADQMVAFGHQGQNSTNSQALRPLKSLRTNIYKACFLKISDSAPKGIRKISDLNCSGFVCVFGFDVTFQACPWLRTRKSDPTTCKVHLRVASSGLATEDKVASFSELKKKKKNKNKYTKIYSI